MIKENLKRRQYKYKVGSVVEFTDRLSYWLKYKKIKSGDFGIVTIKLHDNRSVKVKHIDTDYESWVVKGYHVRLVSKELAIMEKL